MRNLPTKLKCGLLFSLLILAISVGKADSLNVKKDVFLIDVSRSMQGRGSVFTPNVFDDVKSELNATFGKGKPSRIVLIPFSDRVRGALSVDLPQDSSLLRSYIEQLRTSNGRTDIYKAWEAGLDSLHSDVLGHRLYLITDGLHNSRNHNFDSLNALLSNWKDEQKDAYLVLLNPAFENSLLANVFRSNERMYVINSLQELYNEPKVDTIQKVSETSAQQKTIASTEDNEYSLWWLWLLLAILVGGVGVYIGLRKIMSKTDALDLGAISRNNAIEPIGYLSVKSEAGATDVSENVNDEANDYFKLCISDGDIEDDYERVPATGGERGVKDENKERRNLRELADDPYCDSETLFNSVVNSHRISEESKRLMRADLEESRARTIKNSSQKIRRVNGEPDFFSRRFTQVVVRSVTAQELVAKELVNPSLTDDEIDDVIRRENYGRLAEALERRWKLPKGKGKNVIGALFHCTPHEDKSGYVFLVRIPLHMAFPHSGAASAVTKDVRMIFGQEESK